MIFHNPYGSHYIRWYVNAYSPIEELSVAEFDLGELPEEVLRELTQIPVGEELIGECNIDSVEGLHRLVVLRPQAQKYIDMGCSFQIGGRAE